MASEGESSSPSQTEHPSETAVNLFVSSGRKLSNAQHSSEGTGVLTDIFGDSNPAIDTRSHDYQKESLKMPQRQNPHENGLRRSPHLQEKRKADEMKQKKGNKGRKQRKEGSNGGRKEGRKEGNTVRKEGRK